MKAQYKDFFRGIGVHKGKFISVFFIILLGAAFFSGLRSSRHDMLLSAEKYYDDYNLSDVFVMSTAGLTEDDVSAISSAEGVQAAEGVYTLDVFLGGGSAVKLISATTQVNIPEVTEGSLPQNADECLLDNLLLELGEYSVGDTITFTSGDGTDLSTQLACTEFTITGFANLPQYMDLNRGTGSIGDGSIEGFVILAPEAFSLSYYTQVNVLVTGAAALESYESEYDGLIAAATQNIEELEQAACERRYGELYEQAYEQVYDEVMSQLRETYPNVPESFLERIAALYADEIEELVQSAIYTPEWYVLDRTSIVSCVNYSNDAERIASLSELIPIVFYLVAALVSLTAMTRMVDEERRQIGTLKSLGASNGSVLARYMCYALIPTLFGSIVGVLIGEKVFPLAIMKTYGMLYQGLTSYVLPYNFTEGAIAVLAGVISTGVATLAACLRISRENPAAIMRPEAPKPGKRVFMERIPFIWKHLSFTQKSTVRNLFRNKKRFLMTIIGVAGCMGLVLVGLGLNDSITDVVDMQFTELTHYDAYASVQTDDVSELDDLAAGLADEWGVSSLVVYQKSVDVRGDGAQQTVTLCVPSTTEGISDYFTFRTRSHHTAIELSDDGVIISEKTANTLGVSAGDSITFGDGDSQSVTVTISAIYENYVGHYIFMTENLYSGLFASSPSYNMLLLEFDDTSTQFTQQLGTALLANDCVQSVSFTSELVDWANDTLSSLNTIVFIVLAAAALLAFVVLYNLNSINIAERKRELATLKVLGFHDREVAAYVYKENIALTVIGIILGIFLGMFLHQYVITSIEVDMIMFGRSISWHSYLIGAALTLAFSVIINLIMYRSLQRIDMVESLKSVE